MVGRQTSKRIQALEEQAVRRDRETAELSRPPPQAWPPATSAVALPPAPAGFASLIVVDFPALFAEFCGKCFTLLWRGSRDGLGAGDFHRRCNGSAPTLTLLQDTDGNIFDGFTPVEWKSPRGRECESKSDASVKRFLFPLQNQHNFAATKFALKAEGKGRDGAIFCNFMFGPLFRDIDIYDNCNANTRSRSCLGIGYANDTGLNVTFVLTGS
jgi:thiol-disulfide isomerase/thioredoxin